MTPPLASQVRRYGYCLRGSQRALPSLLPFGHGPTMALQISRVTVCVVFAVPFVFPSDSVSAFIPPLLFSFHFRTIFLAPSCLGRCLSLVARLLFVGISRAHSRQRGSPP